LKRFARCFAVLFYQKSLPLHNEGFALFSEIVNARTLNCISICHWKKRKNFLQIDKIRCQMESSNDWLIATRIITPIVAGRDLICVINIFQLARKWMKPSISECGAWVIP
jgi:hypothetical protein